MPHVSEDIHGYSVQGPDRSRGGGRGGPDPLGEKFPYNLYLSELITPGSPPPTDLGGGGGGGEVYKVHMAS